MTLFDYLNSYDCISLVTFRANGEPVATPVWFADVDGTLYVVTRAPSGKVKRIRHNGRVTVAPCDADGTLLGPAVEAVARLADGSESRVAAAALDAKYGAELRRLLKLDAHIARVHLAIAAG
jgi:hypothetical protein